MPTRSVIQVRPGPSSTAGMVSMRRRYIRVQGMQIRGKRIVQQGPRRFHQLQRCTASTWMGVKHGKAYRTDICCSHIEADWAKSRNKCLAVRGRGLRRKCLLCETARSKSLHHLTENCTDHARTCAFGTTRGVSLLNPRRSLLQCK